MRLKNQKPPILYRRLRKTTRYGSPPLHERTFSRSLPRKRGRCREAIGMGFAHHCWNSAITLASFRKFVNSQKWPKVAVRAPFGPNSSWQSSFSPPAVRTSRLSDNSDHNRFQTAFLVFLATSTWAGIVSPDLLFPSPFSNVGHAAGFPESPSHVVHFRVLAPRIVQRRQLVEDWCSFYKFGRRAGSQTRICSFGRRRVVRLHYPPIWNSRRESNPDLFVRTEASSCLRPREPN